MKQLLLIRHGKSDWDHAGLSDHMRPLNSRGLSDAPRMAAALRRAGVSPNFVLSSTAVRAATTADLVCDELGIRQDHISKTPNLYLASPKSILREIQGLDESIETAMIFGHNPGMHETVNLLDSRAVVETFPTLAVARLELKVDYWGEVEWGCGHLLQLLVPRQFEEY